MQAIALALALSLAGGPPAPSLPAAWRLIDRPELHIGVRPAVLVRGDEVALGVTVQVSVPVF